MSSKNPSRVRSVGRSQFLSSRSRRRDHLMDLDGDLPVVALVNNLKVLGRAWP